MYFFEAKKGPAECRAPKIPNLAYIPSKAPMVVVQNTIFTVSV